MFRCALPGIELGRFNIKAWISHLGLVLTLLVAIGGPLANLCINVSQLDNALALRAQLSTTRAAKYIYAQGPLWVHHTARLTEMIEQPGADRTKYRQTLMSGDGRAVVDEDNVIAWPSLARTSAVIVDGQVVGALTIATSLRPAIFDTAPVSLVCLLLAVTTFFGLRVLPLASLRRTLADLDAERQATAMTNERLELALNNTSHGLVLYDTQGRVVVANDKLLQHCLIAGEKHGSVPVFGDLMAWFGLQGHCAEMLNPDGTLACGTSRRIRDLECALTDGRVLVVELQTVPGRGVLVTAEDVTEQHRAQSEIAYLAHFDMLTGLANRAALQRTLSGNLATCSPADMVALMLIDLDRFKGVNDTLGHPVGDELLRHVASRLRDCVRRADTVSRLGGDEFAIVVPGIADIDEVHTIASRILDQLARPYEVLGHRVDVSGSIGVAVAPADSRDLDILFKRADIALYASKTGGRRACRFFVQGMDEEIAKRHQMENDLRRAIEEQQFVLNYQPLFGIAANRIEGFEALLRWHHPARGLVSPAEFIPLAEETGLIRQIGAWALQQACTDAAAWPDDLSIAVNLSSVQFSDKALVTHVAQALERSGLRPGRLELEITESIILQDTEMTLEILRELKALGTRIAMDDFGTGYSSLSYLQKFPFDKIKIDRAFIDGINDKSDSLAIVRAVTSMSRSLGMQTTGEGVETEAELACLRAEGCSQAQGYLISRPIAAAAVSVLIAGRETARLAA